MKQLYRKATELDVPLWVHPRVLRCIQIMLVNHVQYFRCWQTLSWLMDSSAAMVRIVFSRRIWSAIQTSSLLFTIMERWSRYLRKSDANTDGIISSKIPAKNSDIHSAPYIDHFKKFYCDTQHKVMPHYYCRWPMNFLIKTACCLDQMPQWRRVTEKSSPWKPKGVLNRWIFQRQNARISLAEIFSNFSNALKTSSSLLCLTISKFENLLGWWGNSFFLQQLLPTA